MSYPVAPRWLVIEDDDGVKSTYDSIFNDLKSDFAYLPFAPAPPEYAFSLEEAQGCLDESKMFHLVILDLRLPRRPGLPVPDGVELGIKLLEQCLSRDRFPIPSLLVISAHIGTTKQTSLQDALREGFYHGRLLAKGPYEGLQSEIREACQRAIRYCSVGIHIRDGGS